jgi:hypothetical protein
VVWVRRDFCDNVTEREEFVGRFNVVSLFPQYLRELVIVTTATIK